MSFIYKALGGLLTFRFINKVEDMDLDDLQDIYNDLEEDYKELNKELANLREIIEKKNPDERKEKIKQKLKPANEVLSNEDIPYEVRMKYIIDAYRKDQKKWAKLAEYAKHLEGEVLRLKEILISNGYTDNGIVGDSDSAKVISDLKKKVKELEAKDIMPKDVSLALITIRKLENQIENFPLKVYKSQSFRNIINKQEEYIKQLQTLLDFHGIEYELRESVGQLENAGVDNVVDKAVSYGNNFKVNPMFVNTPRQIMRVNFFKNLTTMRPQKKDFVKIIY